MDEVRLNNLSPDALFLIAVNFDYPELLQFCSSSKRINDLICRRDRIWLHRLERDYPNWRDFKIDKSPRDTYKVLYGLTVLKDKLGLDYGLLDLFNLQDLSLYNKNLTEIPKEIGQLHNLQKLCLGRNNLTEIPKEIGQLHNLRRLEIYRNKKLTEIPKELGQLHNLRYLFLNHNNLIEIPKEIGQLHSLKQLSLYNNKLTEIPKELGQLQNLQNLYLDKNNLTEIPKEIENIPGLQIYK